MDGANLIPKWDPNAARTITKLELEDDVFIITFDDSTKIRILDSWSPLEQKYMRTDDNLSDYIGATLLKIEVKNCWPGDIPTDNEYDYTVVHDIQFLEIDTDKGIITLVNHNEHNGNYGVFDLSIEII